MDWVREIRDAVVGLLAGKHNAAGSITLTAASATSALADRRIHPESVITFMPRTANAAAEMDNMYISARTNESATITHTNNSQSDRSFDYSVGGG